ncbi:MAG: replicative DNA helicase [Actinobacteria bacterium]|nr:MAG: replicative DNA helicase [Actinomycetota bacterium]
MLMSTEAVETALTKIASPAEFQRSGHQAIFEAIRHLYDHGIPVDQVSVADRLEATDGLERIGGKDYLIDVGMAVPTPAHAAHYAEIVSRTALLRQLIDAGTAIVELGFDAPDDASEAIEQAERLLFDVTGRRISGAFQPLLPLLEEGFLRLEELAERQEHVTGVATGFHKLDSLLSGFQKGNLIIIGARPSVGKTALALNMAVNAALLGNPVAIFSLEMSSDELVQRVICSEGRINLQHLRTGHLKDTDWTSINSALSRLSKCDIQVDDTPATTILEIRTKARRLLKDRPGGMIIVDYLQLMQPTTRRVENRQAEVAEISRGLKILAKELEVPIVCLSQLSRGVESRGGRPRLSDLRESGAIEQDADVVIFIHRDVYGRSEDDDGGEDRKYPPLGEAELIVAKNRNGPTDTVHVAYIPENTKFVDLARDPR